MRESPPPPSAIDAVRGGYSFPVEPSGFVGSDRLMYLLFIHGNVADGCADAHAGWKRGSVWIEEGEGKRVEEEEGYERRGERREDKRRER